MLSKLLLGQEVSAYTKDGHVFEGYVHRNSEGKKLVLNEQGKWLLLEDLCKIKQVGKKLNEETEQAVDNVINKLSPEKVSSKETEFENLAKQIADAAGFSPSDANRSDIEKYAQEKLIGLKSEVDAEKNGNQAALEKAKDELKQLEKSPEEQLKNPTLEESQFIENKKKLNEYANAKARRMRLGEDAAYDIYENDINDDEISFDDDFYLDNNLEVFDPEEDFTYDVFDDKSFDDDLSDEEYTDEYYTDEYTDDIDMDVDRNFEDALDNYENLGGDFSDTELLGSLAKQFGGSASRALHETSNIPDAVCHLAEQVKELKRNQSSLKK